jgi:general secretion pathway protein L
MPRGLHSGGSIIGRLRLDALLHWWLAELGSFVPSGLRGKAHKRKDRLIVAIDDREVVVFAVLNEAIRELRRLAVGSDVEQVPETLAQDALNEGLGSETEVVVALMPRQVLCRQLTLPQAAEENLCQVLGFEMDRQTPFTSEQVYYDYRVIERDPQTHRLRVELFVALRKQVDSALARVSRWGLRPVAVDMLASEASGQLADINLLPSEYRPETDGSRAKLNLWLFTLIGVLSVTAVGIPLLQHRKTTIDLRQQAAEAQRQAEEVAQLREAMDHSLEAATFVVDKKRSEPVMVDILNELTGLIPDDTWIQLLELKGNEVRLQGESGAASALIGIIEASPLFEQASFRSPVTRIPTSGRERFNLTAKVSQAGGS